MQVKCLPVLSPGELLAQRKQASRNEPAAAALDADLDLDLDDVLEDTPQLRKLRQIREHSIAARGGSTSGRLLSIGDHGASNNPETELYWQGTTLVWSRGASVVRTFTFDENVNQACWAWLDLGCADRPQRLGKLTNTEGLNGQSDLASMAGAGSPNPLHATQASSTPFSPAQRQMRVRTSPQADAGMVNDAKLERALCVFLERVLVIYLPFSGDEHTLPLPFKLKQAMPMTVGLLIQRDTETGDLKLASETVSDPNRGPTILAELTELQNADGPATEQEGAPTAEVAQPLPTVFSLRRPFDEFRPVSRVAQISQETSSVRDSAVDAHGSNSPPERTRTLLHGNPSHMSDVEEVIVFVADGSPIAPLPVIVSVNVPARCVRIYAYADGSGEVASVPLAAAAELSPTEEISQSARGGESQVSQMGLDLTGFASASTRAIGRGRPPPRKSARLEMQRRTSGFGAASGRDRSKRISSMHGGDLRIVSRQEAPDGPAGSSQYRDDMADFVEGLTRPPDQEEAGNASVRPSGASTRARRPSDNLHRTRTPYGPPRTVSRQPSTAARQPSTAARGRPSVSRPDMSMNYDPMSLGMGSATQPARAAFDLRMQEAQFSSAEADGERLNMDGLADTNQYAAHVSILEDIEIPELDR